MCLILNKSFFGNFSSPLLPSPSLPSPPCSITNAGEKSLYREEWVSSHCSDNRSGNGSGCRKDMGRSLLQKPCWQWILGKGMQASSVQHRLEKLLLTFWMEITRAEHKGWVEFHRVFPKIPRIKGRRNLIYVTILNYVITLHSPLYLLSSPHLLT